MTKTPTYICLYNVMFYRLLHLDANVCIASKQANKPCSEIYLPKVIRSLSWEISRLYYESKAPGLDIVDGAMYTI